jgi:hypothetical protein
VSDIPAGDENIENFFFGVVFFVGRHSVEDLMLHRFEILWRRSDTPWKI